MEYAQLSQLPVFVTLGPTKHISSMANSSVVKQHGLSEREKDDLQPRNLEISFSLGYYQIWLVVEPPTPLKNDGVKVSWDDDIPNIWKHNPNVPNNQPEIVNSYPKLIPQTQKNNKWFLGYKYVNLGISYDFYPWTIGLLPYAGNLIPIMLVPSMSFVHVDLGTTKIEKKNMWYPLVI